jgi:phage/plasmid-associated DNA primase
LVEFGVTIPESERDTTIPDRLREEYGGILAWALEGCLKWQRDGLSPPESVRVATAAYLAGEDMIGAWIEECCERCSQITLTAAHRSYRAWCERNGASVLGRNSFGDQLEVHGIKRTTDSHTKAQVFAGLSLPVPEDRRYRE